MYVMDGKILESVEEEQDLGVIIQSSLKVDKQCAKTAKIANSELGMIRKSFINRRCRYYFVPIQVSSSS